MAQPSGSVAGSPESQEMRKTTYCKIVPLHKAVVAERALVLVDALYSNHWGPVRHNSRGQWLVLPGHGQPAADLPLHASPWVHPASVRVAIARTCKTLLAEWALVRLGSSMLVYVKLKI